MADDIAEYLRRIDEKLDRILEVMQDAKPRPGSLVVTDVATLSVRMDRVDARLERIEKRLDLVEA